jgi:hypothetical protein
MQLKWNYTYFLCIKFEKKAKAMNINKALKEKNRLVREINRVKNTIREHNSIIQGNERPFEIKKLYQELNELLMELVSIKTKLMIANRPILDKIFKISELRSLTSFVKDLTIKEGKYKEAYSSSDALVWDSEIGYKEKDQLIRGLEKEIDQLQSEVDAFNFATTV